MSIELCFLTATELARRIRASEVSVTEVVRAHLTQIERVNPRVNAIVTSTSILGSSAMTPASSVSTTSQDAPR